MLGPLSRLLAGRTLWLLVGLLVLIEAIFIAESFTTLMAIVVSNGGSVWDILLLLLLKSPEIVDFALPLAILIGLYFAITTSRDENELVVYSAAGVSWLRIPQFALGVGIIGMLVSVLFAGFVTPTANYAQRIAIHLLETHRVIQEITNPAPQNARREIRNRTIIATPPSDDTSVRGNLFIFEELDGDSWRVSQAKDWSVEGPEDDESYSVRLNSFRDYVGQGVDQNGLGNEQLGLQLNTARMQVRNLTLDFRLEELVRAIDRNRNPNEQILFTFRDLSKGLEGKTNRRFGEIIGRAIVCLLAGGVAVAAVAFSAGRIGRFLALPIAVVAVMGGDIAARTWLGDAANNLASAFWPAVLLCIALAVSVPMIYPLLHRERLITPLRGRD